MCGAIHGYHGILISVQQWLLFRLWLSRENLTFLSQDIVIRIESTSSKSVLFMDTPTRPSNPAKTFPTMSNGNTERLIDPPWALAASYQQCMRRLEITPLPRLSWKMFRNASPQISEGTQVMSQIGDIWANCPSEARILMLFQKYRMHPRIGPFFPILPTIKALALCITQGKLADVGTRLYHVP